MARPKYRWLVTSKDGSTCEVAADDVACYGSGALEFRQQEHDCDVQVLAAFARGQWIEVRRSDASLAWHPAPVPEPPRFA